MTGRQTGGAGAQDCEHVVGDGALGDEAYRAAQDGHWQSLRGRAASCAVSVEQADDAGVRQTDWVVMWAPTAASLATGCS